MTTASKGTRKKLVSTCPSFPARKPAGTQKESPENVDAFWFGYARITSLICTFAVKDEGGTDGEGEEGKTRGERAEEPKRERKRVTE